jgi:hypothetical protein
MAEGDQRLGQRPPVGVDVPYQLDVELDDVGLKAPDVSQAGEPGAGVVDRELDACSTPFRKCASQRVVVIDPGVLGDLDDHAVPREGRNGLSKGRSSGR